MADLSLHSAEPVGEKRKLLCRSPERKTIKLRRFDVQIPVPHQKLTNVSTCPSNSSPPVPSSSVLFPASSAGKCLAVHAGREDSSALDVRLVDNSRPTQTSIADCHYRTPNMSGSKPSVSMLVRCSLEESKLNSKISEGHSSTMEINTERSSQGVQIQGLQTSIVDELFREFIAAKIKEVSDGSNGSNAKQTPSAAKNDCGQLGTSKDSDPVAVSMEEISRLLDAEITSIQSRSTIPLRDGNSETEGENSCTETLTVAGERSVLSAAELREDTVQQTLVETHSAETLHTYSDLQPCSDTVHESGKPLTLLSLGCNLPPLQNSDGSTLGSTTMVEVCMPVSSAKTNTADISVDGDIEGIHNQKVDSKPVSSLGKKHPAKKLDISIRQESLALIMGMPKVAGEKTLEEGEAAFSSDAEEDKLKAASQEKKEDNESDDNEVTETGSLSETDEDKSADKRSSKSRKKKKHKHKHKKKKKHKSQSKDKKDGDKRSSDKEEKTIKSKTKDGKTKNDTEGTKEKKHSKERKGSGSSKISRSRSGSPSHSRKNGRSRSPRSSHRARSHSRERRRSKDRLDPWDARNYRDSNHSSHNSKRTQSRSRSRSRGRSYDRSRRRSRERSSDKRGNRSHGRHHSHDRNRSSQQEDNSDDLRIRIDKNKLRKIAIANALANMESGQGPPVDISAIKCGGKSIAELTDFCKRISEREKEQKEGHMSDSGSSDAETHNSEPEDSLIHHPFKLRDPSTVPSIIMNIRNAKQLPVLTPQEKQAQAAVLRSQFPVSSGAQHRTKESEWVPVTPTTAETNTTSTATTSKSSTAGVLPEPVGVIQSVAVSPAPAAPAEQSVFQEVSQQNIDIGSIISERLQAVRKLQENPFDVQALSTIHKAQEKANQWAVSKQLPGQFLGTTGVQCLTPQELAGPDKRNQAWARKVGHFVKMANV